MLKWVMLIRVLEKTRKKSAFKVAPLISKYIANCRYNKHLDFTNQSLFPFVLL